MNAEVCCDGASTQLAGTSSISSIGGIDYSLSTATSGYWSTDISYGDTLSTSAAFEWTTVMSDEDLKKLVERILDNEEDLVPILKNYFAKYFESLMDNPEELIDTAVKEIIDKKDKEIERLGQKVEELSNKLDYLINLIHSKSYNEEELRTNIGSYPWSGYPWSYYSTSTSAIVGNGSATLPDSYDSSTLTPDKKAQKPY